MPEARYWTVTRSPRYSLLFALPLLLAYETLARIISGQEGIRNGADVLLRSLFLLLGGRHGLTLFAVVLLGTGAVLVARDWHRNGAPVGRYFLGMALESTVYAVLFGGVASILTAMLIHPRSLALGQGVALSLPTQLMVSLGAGVYEELLFRVILVGGLARLGTAGFGWRPWYAGLFATLVGALIFSAFHYIGPLGDQFTVNSFVFRAVAGVLLSGLYLIRGFGITAWTHALYDVLLTVGI